MSPPRAPCLTTVLTLPLFVGSPSLPIAWNKLRCGDTPSAAWYFLNHGAGGSAPKSNRGTAPAPPPLLHRAEDAAEPPQPNKTQPPSPQQKYFILQLGPGPLPRWRLLPLPPPGPMLCTTVGPSPSPRASRARAPQHRQRRPSFCPPARALAQCTKSGLCTRLWRLSVALLAKLSPHSTQM